ncbi:MAG: Blue-light-activated protein [Syntrophorhabdus sp. PtaU1.Bin153]|nr:MAG: Blue-light-activated protein [Syntrophorhabdus sp. PtaU1.Bin153]
MRDSSRKTKSELIQENSILKERMREFEESELDHRQNEEHMSLALQRLHFHNENSPLAVVEFDPEFRVIYWSGQAMRVFGWSAKEMLGKRIDEMKWVHEDDAERVAKLSEDMLKGRCSSNVHSNRNYRKDGSVITCEWYNSALLNRQGELVSVLSSILDITERERAEEGLKESEEKFRVLAQSTPMAIMLYQDNRWVYANPAAERITGYSLQELLRMNFWDFVHPKHRHLVRRRGQRRQRAENTINRYQLRLVAKDGSDRWVDLAGSSTTLGGRPAGIISITDITELKRTEIALRESEERFRAFMDNSPTIAWAKDEQGRQVYLNRTYEQRFGVWLKDWEGKTDFELWPPEIARKFRENDLAVLDAGRTLDMVEDTVEPGGSHSWWWNFKFPFQDASGRRYVGGIGVDITDRKQLEMELNKLATVVRNTTELVGLATLDGRIVYVNDAGVRMLGLSSGEIEQTTIFQVVPEHLRSELQDEILPTLNERGRWEGEIQYCNLKSGAVTDVYATIFVVNDPATGLPLYLANTSRDITDHKRAEEALRRAHEELELRVQERTTQLSEAYKSLQHEMGERKQAEERLRQVHKMEAIGTLAGGIAHDFNNILAAIMGFAEMIEEDLPPDSRSIRRIQRVLSAASRGRDLVRQILTFSRKTGLAKKPLSLSPIVEETVQLLRASLPSTNEIRLRIEATKDTVLASPAELQQILMNLSTNASFAMKEKGGILRISITNIHFEPDSPILDEDIESGEYVQLRVTDTGIGMVPEVKKRIFEPFFTTKGVGEGTGMGLAVVYGIVKSLGGTITVESEPETGSTFRVFLPVARADEQAEAGKAGETPRGSEHILFVDDEELLTEWGQGVLESLGYSVTALADSTEALKLFSSDPSRFDLVITDHTMPKLTGLNLVRKLLAIRNDVPIILCTGHSDSVSPEKARETGIKEFLMKPIERRQLAEAIRRALSATGPEVKTPFRKN